MRIKNLLTLIAFALCLAFSAQYAPAAGEGAGETGKTRLEVVEAAMATGIENNAPVGTGDTFSPDVGKLWCYSKIAGSEGDSSITHRWYFGERLMAVVPLTLRSNPYRTNSSKTILPGWTGNWRVDITAEDGTVLESVSFKVE